MKTRLALPLVLVAVLLLGCDSASAGPIYTLYGTTIGRTTVFTVNTSTGASTVGALPGVQ
jgi:hypothetical protein